MNRKVCFILVAAWVYGCGDAANKEAVVSSTASANDVHILWAKNPSPPFHILEGTYQGYGICDVLVDKINQLVAPLPTKTEVFPQSRVRKLIDSDQNLCFPCMIKRPDNNRFIYSERTTVYPALGVIIHNDSLSQSRFNQSGSVSLAQLLSDKQLIFGYAEARRFPDVLQQVVDGHADATNLKALPGILGPLRVLQQIDFRRIHYTLDYPGVMRYFELMEDKQILTYLPTEEYGDHPVEGAIGCSNNAWGRRAIKTIDGVLNQVMQDPEYINNQQFWLNTVPVAAQIKAD